VYSDAIGFQDSQPAPMPKDAIFRLLMTKPLVTVATMMLVEEGKSS
jgi:CubicO group peptidase (beta-lactamase class C family)